MKKMFNFSLFCKTVQSASKDITAVEENYARNYVYMVIQNDIRIQEIDFSKFTVDDLVVVFNDLDSVISGEDTSGNISIDPKHPYTRIQALSHKVDKLREMPKQRPSSPFLFL